MKNSIKLRKARRIWGKPWDSCYLLYIEQWKLREMAKYFKKSQLAAGRERQVKEIELCIKLIDIILEKDSYYNSWLKLNHDWNPHETIVRPFPKYINTGNINRFIPGIDIKTFNPDLIESIKVQLRINKAFYLYHKIRLERMLTWWD